jgi:hypothetical protein
MSAVLDGKGGVALLVPAIEPTRQGGDEAPAKKASAEALASPGKAEQAGDAPATQADAGEVKIRWRDLRLFRM